MLVLKRIHVTEYLSVLSNTKSLRYLRQVPSLSLLVLLLVFFYYIAYVNFILFTLCLLLSYCLCFFYCLIDEHCVATCISFTYICLAASFFFKSWNMFLKYKNVNEMHTNLLSIVLITEMHYEILLSKFVHELFHNFFFIIISSPLFTY